MKSIVKKCLYTLGAVVVVAALVILITPPTSLATVFLGDVNITNSTSSPVNTLDVAPMHAWVTSATVPISGSPATGTVEIADTQPANSRYVIENVSIYCTGPIGSNFDAGIITYNSNTETKSTYNYVPLVFQGNQAGKALWVGNAATKLYSDISGGTVMAGGDMTGTGTGTCNFSISGHLATP